MSGQRQDTPYASIQAIREGAGLLSFVNNETPTGDTDGSNTVFTVVRRPIVDGNYDDVVGVEDVQAFVDGTAVEVSNVDAAAGTITLAVAPGNNTQVTVDYQFSPISDEYVTQKQDEANSWVNLKISSYVACPLKAPIPGIITSAAEMYAAGLILTKDWGNRVDSELTSKDGAAKIKMARDLLADYIQGLKDAQKNKGNHNGNTNSISATSDHDVFSRHEHELGHHGQFDHTDDDGFMRREH